MNNSWHYPDLPPLLGAAVSAVAVLVVTYLLSTLRSRPRSPHDGHEPPLVPYYIPYFQHLFHFLWNPGRLFHAAHARSQGSPFTLLLAGTKFHVFHSDAAVKHVFGQPQRFAFEPVVASMMENGVNLPEVDRHMFHVQPKSASTKENEGSHAFIVENHNIWLRYLTGSRLHDIMQVYMENFRLVLNRHLDVDGTSWCRLDFHELMRKLIFETSLVTFFGSRLYDHWPDPWGDWKRFNDATYFGVRSNWAYHLQPGAGKARERMLHAFEKWCDIEPDDWDTPDAWNSTWGIKMNWERELLARRHGFSHRGRACLHAGFLFVIVTNAAPMATWFAFCACKNAETLTRYRDEAAATAADISQDGPSDKAQVAPAPKKNEYLQAVWKEALRLGSTSAAARVVMEDCQIEGYVVKRGSVILLPVQLMHFDPTIFPQPHSLQPERWITKDPPDAMERQQQKLRSQRLRSFGGGTGLCSGRFVAEREIINVVSTFLLRYDIRFEQAWDDFRFNPRSIGIMSPAGPVMAWVKPR